MTNEEKRESLERLLKNAPYVLTPVEVSRWTRYGRNTVYKMLKDGTLKGYVLRGAYLVGKEDLIEFMVEHMTEILRLSKRKCSWMLQNGILPCKDSGKKTRRYTIRRDDVITCLENLHTYDISRIFSSVPDSPQKQNFTDEQIKKYTAFLLRKWRCEPNPLTDTQVAELIGYSLGSVQRWLNNEHIRTAKAHGEWCIPKLWLADFCCHYGYRIVRKSEKHREIEREFFKE